MLNLFKNINLPASLFRALNITSTKKNDDHQSYKSQNYFFAFDLKDSQLNDQRIQKAVIQHDYFSPYNMRLPYLVTSTGIDDTLEFLYHYRDDPEKIKAILIMACLYQYELHGLFYQEYSDLIKLLDEESGLWCYPKRYVLPEPRGLNLFFDFETRWYLDKKTTNKENFKLHIANHLNKVLSRLEFVIVSWVSEETPLYQQVNSDMLIEQARQIEQDKIWAQERAEAAKKLVEIKKDHPRFGEWGRIDKQELTHLVWSHPADKVGHQFNVSGSAVSKKCKKFGIKKPIKGFWRKVETKLVDCPSGVVLEKFTEDYQSKVKVVKKKTG